MRDAFLRMSPDDPCHFILRRARDSERNTLETIEAARKAVEIASDKQASDVVLLDLRGLATFVDFFVICSAESNRQISAIANALEARFHTEGLRLAHREGTDESGWVLLDFSDIIVHIFSPKERGLYDLEEAWNKAPALARIH